MSLHDKRTTCDALIPQNFPSLCVEGVFKTNMNAKVAYILSNICMIQTSEIMLNIKKSMPEIHIKTTKVCCSQSV